MIQKLQGCSRVHQNQRKNKKEGYERCRFDDLGADD